jgi:hypothetical protein
MYLLHARNLATGQPYEATGYVFNPREPHIGPPNYPPLLPAILAPVYRVSGLNLTPMKALLAIVFASSLLFLYLLLPVELPPAWRLALIAVVGFNPSYWMARDDVQSEFLFLLCVYAALYGTARWLGGTETPPLWMAPLFAVLLALPYSARTLGLAVLPVPVLYDLLRVRKVRLFPLLACGIAFGACLGVAAAFHTSGGFSGLFDFHPAWLLAQAIENARRVRSFWANGFSDLFSYAALSLSYVLAIYGIWRYWRKAWGPPEIFAAAYLAVVLPYQVTVYRYLMPLIPFYLAYAFLGVRDFRRRIVVTAGVAVVLVTYASAYATAPWGPIREGVNDPEFVALANAVKQQTVSGDLVIFRKPRVLALLTERRAAVYPTMDDGEGVWSYMRSVKAAYVVKSGIDHPEFEVDEKGLAECLKQHRSEVTEVYSNQGFKLYRLDFQ